MAGVHGHEHVERLGTAHFADDDPRRAHPQRVAHQIANADLTNTLDVLAAHLERDAVRQLAVEQQLGYFLDGHHAFVERGDRGAERVQQRGLAAARLTAD